MESFSIYVKVKDGRADVDRIYGNPADGTYIISGHDHDGQQMLGVSQQRQRKDEAGHKPAPGLH